MNVSSMYAEIGRLLNDANNDRWSQSVLLTRMNLATTRILALTNAVKTKETLTATANTAAVQLATSVLDVIRVDINRTNGDWVKLRGFTRDQIDFEDPGWQQRTAGEPLGYWWDGTNQQLNLIPVPDAANAIASGLRVWEIQIPTDLANTNDVPFGSNTAMVPYHMAIVHYVVAQCWMDDGTPEGLSKSKFHRSDDFGHPGKFESEIKMIWKKFDAPEDIPNKILWRPEGGRASKIGVASKSNPLNL